MIAAAAADRVATILHGGIRGSLLLTPRGHGRTSRFMSRDQRSGGLKAGMLDTRLSHFSHRHLTTTLLVSAQCPPISCALAVPHISMRGGSHEDALRKLFREGTCGVQDDVCMALFQKCPLHEKASCFCIAQFKMQIAREGICFKASGAGILLASPFSETT